MTASDRPAVPLDPFVRDTSPRIFYSYVDRRPGAEALRGKVAGRWQGLCVSRGGPPGCTRGRRPRDCGSARGRSVRTAERNRPEWAIADYAMLMLGAVDVPIYPSLSAPQLAHVLQDVEARVIIVSKAELTGDTLPGMRMTAVSEAAVRVRWLSLVGVAVC